MTDREQEKLILDRIIALKDSEVAQLFAKLFRVRLEMHKTSLVASGSEETRGRAKECQTFLKELHFNGD